jgi:hypothetical protein
MFESSFLSIYNRVHLEPSRHCDRQRGAPHFDPRLLNSNMMNRSSNTIFPRLAKKFTEFRYNVHDSPLMDTIPSQFTHSYPTFPSSC